MSKKLTYEFVKEQFENYDYILSSTEYISAKTKLNYICPNGHTHSITWNNWQQGDRCPYCIGKANKSIKEIRNLFKEAEYKLVSETYIDVKTKLDFICQNGHKNSMSWSSWQQGNRCSMCSKNKKLTIDFIKQDFEKFRYILLSTYYINSNTKLNYICPEGHEHTINWNNWLHGKRCPTCAGNIKYTLDFIKKEFEKEDYILLSIEYINAHTKLNYCCPNGHLHDITWDSWINSGSRCPKCINNSTSRFEQQVKDFIVEQNQDIIENDRTIIKNHNTNYFLELDILLPCKTKAIECNGVYWHSRPEAKVKDKIKQDQCKKLGINLLTITDESWYNDREKCEKIIKELINE